MARSPESNAAFFREVDDEVRRERMAQMGRRYGILAVAIVLIGLLAFGGYLLWRNHDEARAGARGEALTAALSSLGTGNKDAARAKLAPLAADGGKGYAALAALTLADMQVQSGQTKPAADAFAKVAADGDAPQPLRDLALLRATALGFDTLAPAEVVQRLKPLVVPGGAWFGSASELTGIAQMKLGQNKQAAATFAAMARDTAVPDTLRERARQLAGDLGVDVTPPVAAPAIVR